MLVVGSGPGCDAHDDGRGGGRHPCSDARRGLGCAGERRLDGRAHLPAAGRRVPRVRDHRTPGVGTRGDRRPPDPCGPRSRLHLGHRRGHGRLARRQLDDDRRLAGHPRLRLDVPALAARARPGRHADDPPLRRPAGRDQAAARGQPLSLRRPAAGRPGRQPVVLVGEPPHDRAGQRVPGRAAVPRRHVHRHGAHRREAPGPRPTRHPRVGARARRRSASSSGTPTSTCSRTSRPC